MSFTEKGGAALEAYLSRVRRSLEGRSELDATDVVAGIREHVEAELITRSVDVATAEDVMDVLERLGPAESLHEPEAGEAETRIADVARGPAVAILVLALVGIAALPTVLMPVGLTLLAVSVVGARVVLPGEVPVGNVEGRMIRLLWQAGVAGVGLVLLVGPAVLVWASAQIGGVLEEPLSRHAGVLGRERPLRYWSAMAAVAGALSGMWWVLLGLLLHSFAAVVGRALGPARRLIPDRTATALLFLGAGLIVLSILGVWI